ncbi:hypothetical protein ACFL1I_01815 [Candidatus Omnitrophota bacterium]
MRGHHWHTFWIIAVVLCVVLVAGYMFLLQIGILDTTLFVNEFEWF